MAVSKWENVNSMKPIDDYKEDVFLCCSSCLNCMLSYPMYLPVCPALEKYGFVTYASKGRSGLIESYLSGQIKMSEEFANIMYSCALCGACRVSCQQDWSYYNLEVFEAIREEIIDKGFAPPEVRDFLQSVYKYGNPFSEPREKRADWAKDTDVKKYKGQEYLLFVGSVGSYDPRAQKISKALSSILIKAGISFGILGIEETDDGNEVNKVGERGLFEYLADENIEKFKNLGVKKIITLSPHSFNAIKNNYPAFGGDFEVMHYTQFLKQLIETGQLQIKGRLDADVTFHDPCFLGRYNKEYEAPRFLLGSIPGLRLIEMERNKEDSFCCGGGGGNFFTDFLGSGEKGAGRIRIREAFDTKAKILAVACPMCAGMFEDALKMEWLEDEFTVKDIAEIINELI